ncbi:cysteine desulfurase sulfur acceptor subunit CsdE [Erwinia sp.]|uniref:cysteine desulfurase sulfur acceptor subunit CsdE n=1 Tax=Erwinia citreus TaxID=558 RepID=UPI00289B92F9|nr:cysteine desulfurase sulfur acceptor subunit CsdE [Erwinia sp.]
MTTLPTPHPFGTLITADSLKQTFSAFTQWEERYRQLILLGKQLPALAEEWKTAERELSGCENRVWLGYHLSPEGCLHFYGDSEGRIVRGLLALLLVSVEGKRPAEIIQNDPLALFEELGLRDQLSASRSAGLVALAEAVMKAARDAG